MRCRHAAPAALASSNPPKKNCDTHAASSLACSSGERKTSNLASASVGPLPNKAFKWTVYTVGGAGMYPPWWAVRPMRPDAIHVRETR